MTERSHENIDAAAKALAKWIGYAWDGLSEGRIIDKGFRPWHYSHAGGKQFQGGKEDLRDMARHIADLADGERGR